MSIKQLSRLFFALIITFTVIVVMVSKVKKHQNQKLVDKHMLEKVVATNQSDPENDDSGYGLVDDEILSEEQQWVKNTVLKGMKFDDAKFRSRLGTYEVYAFPDENGQKVQVNYYRNKHIAFLVEIRGRKILRHCFNDESRKLVSPDRFKLPAFNNKKALNENQNWAKRNIARGLKFDPVRYESRLGEYEYYVYSVGNAGEVIAYYFKKSGVTVIRTIVTSEVISVHFDISLSDSLLAEWKTQ